VCSDEAAVAQLTDPSFKKRVQAAASGYLQPTPRQSGLHLSPTTACPPSPFVACADVLLSVALL
jgi:hypothetical protein